VLAGLQGADLLHVHSVGPGLCVPIARVLGMKVVFTVHGADYEREKWGPLARAMLRLGERLGARNANRTIAVSRQVQQLLRLNHAAQAAFIPNGIEIPSRPTSACRLERWGLEPRKYAFAIGRLEPGKGFDELIDAFGGLEAEWKLAIAGRADHPSAYSRDLQARAGRAERVVLTGFVQGEDLAQLYAHCGLFVLPSHHEGLPIALLEALSYGCSVLASDIPANRAVPLRPDRFFKVGQVRDLREKIARWMERGIGEEEKQRNLRVLREHYDWDAVARRTLEVYREVVGGDA
jgi:glycosyltransferase involved in cell wall biosynthesis